MKNLRQKLHDSKAIAVKQLNRQAAFMMLFQHKCPGQLTKCIQVQKLNRRIKSLVI